MKLKEIFERVEFDEIVRPLVEIEPLAESDLGSYKRAFDLLRRMTPQESDGVVIEVFRRANDEGGEPTLQAWFHSRTDWEVMLSREVAVAEDCKATNSEIAAILLWEITFWGFSPEGLEEKIKEWHAEAQRSLKGKKRARKARNAEELRTRLVALEGKIRGIVGGDPLRFYLGEPSHREIDRIDWLLGERKMILDRMFSFSEEEIRLIEDTNNRLNELRKRMFQRSANLYRTILRYGQDESFDDGYFVEGTLDNGVDFDEESGDGGTVRRLENDDFYGSDFAYMLFLIRENAGAHLHSLDYVDNCLVGCREGDSPEMTDAELDCDYTQLDDGTSWNECLMRPDLAHIRFGHAFHSFFTHHNYALADILRINKFDIEIKLTINHGKEN